MGRPSLAEPRREQMLAAITRCIAKHGLAASTQEVIARESGFSRSHIRHYLGNREAVISAVWDHMLTPYSIKLTEALDDEDPAVRTAQVIDFLFGPEMERKPEDLAIEALIDGSTRHPVLRRRIERTYHELEAQIATHLRSVNPRLSVAEAEEAGFAIVALSFGTSSLCDLGFPETRWLAMKATASRIIDHALASGHDQAPPS
ncbi:MAG: TetR family transcriptional regulator [Nocardioides sp.]|uniref:TetR/AcrR family transcriptional regulator n=1 Tax=Nocardioides sp. TaxID=35761 RepID=UPI0039E28C23